MDSMLASLAERVFTDPFSHASSPPVITQCITPPPPDHFVAGDVTHTPHAPIAKRELELHPPDQSTQDKLSTRKAATPPPELSELEKLPPEILEKIISLALDAGVEPKEIWHTSSTLLYMVGDYISSQLNKLIEVFEQAVGTPSASVVLARWPEGQKIAAWVKDMLGEDHTNEFKKHTKYMRQGIEAQLDAIYKTSLKLLPTALDSWSKNQQNTENLDSKRLIDNFVEVYEQNLSCINFNQQSLREIPEYIGCLQSVTYLDASFNVLRKFPETICKVKSLEKLFIEYNQIETISSDIGLLRNLIYLNLNSNPITKLPRQIGDLPKLKIFKAARLNIVEFGVMENQFNALERLDLTRNRFLLRLPRQLANLPKLSCLIVKENPELQIPVAIHEQAFRIRIEE